MGLGRGEALWDKAISAVLAWEVKTRSGFDLVPPVEPGARVRIGERRWLITRVGPIAVREPVTVVAVVDQIDRQGFAYGTLEGHPVSGEEAFVVHRATDDSVSLTLRSLTRPGGGKWLPLYPATLIAQHWYRRRYLRALAETRTQSP